VWIVDPAELFEDILIAGKGSTAIGLCCEAEPYEAEAGTLLFKEEDRTNHL
jgi:hypothetical protein